MEPTILEEFNQHLRDCRSCRLGGLHGTPIPGYGNPNSPIVLIGEAPGEQENRTGRPFVGNAGKELQKLLSSIDLDLDCLYRTNTVRCWPGPGNPDPTEEEKSLCSSWLKEELSIIQPRIVISMGLHATSHFLGKNITMEAIHGRPQSYNGFTLLPVYHPAAALHNPKLLPRLREDFSVLPSILTNSVVPGVEDLYHAPNYLLVDSLPLTPDITTVAMDTESDRNGDLWCASFCWEPGTAYVMMARDLTNLTLPGDVVLHNATYDLRVLSKAGIHLPNPIHDTMLMAYALEEERLSLKILSKRYLGMEMRDYSEVVLPGQRPISTSYLSMVASGDWPDSPPVEEWAWEKKGGGYLKVHIKHPQHISKKAKRIIADTLSRSADPWKRWHDIDISERRVVEESLGPMPRASLEDCDHNSAIYYSARDADSTLRLYHYLLNKIGVGND